MFPFAYILPGTFVLILIFFSGTTHDYDVAIIVLSEDIEFNNHVQPACLPDSNTVYEPGKKCLISGWGRTGDGKFCFGEVVLAFQNGYGFCASRATMCCHVRVVLEHTPYPLRRQNTPQTTPPV